MQFTSPTMAKHTLVIGCPCLSCFCCFSLLLCPVFVEIHWANDDYVWPSLAKLKQNLTLSSFFFSCCTIFIWSNYYEKIECKKLFKELNEAISSLSLTSQSESVPGKVNLFCYLFLLSLLTMWHCTRDIKATIALGKNEIYSNKWFPSQYSFRKPIYLARYEITSAAVTFTSMWFGLNPMVKARITFWENMKFCDIWWQIWREKK